VGFILKWIWCSLRGEVWGWALFYAGTAGVAFGSAYYHLKPDDDRVIWDTLPVSITIVFQHSQIQVFIIFYFLCLISEKL
jgi:hypothetical protein